MADPPEPTGNGTALPAFNLSASLPRNAPEEMDMEDEEMDKMGDMPDMDAPMVKSFTKSTNRANTLNRRRRGYHGSTARRAPPARCGSLTSACRSQLVVAVAAALTARWAS